MYNAILKMLASQMHTAPSKHSAPPQMKRLIVAAISRPIAKFFMAILVFLVCPKFVKVNEIFIL